MKQLRIILVFIIIAALFPATLLAQEDTATESIDLLEAMAIVREAYGEEFIILAATFNADNTCWQFEFADGTQVCVDDVTGEILLNVGSDDGTVDDVDNGAVGNIDDGAVDDTDDGAVNDVDNGEVGNTDDGAVDDTDDGAVNDVDNGEVGNTDDGAVNNVDDGEVDDTHEGAVDNVDDGAINNTDDGAVDVGVLAATTLEEAITTALSLFPDRVVTSVSFQMLDDGTFSWDIGLDDVLSVDVDATTGDILFAGDESEDSVGTTVDNTDNGTVGNGN